MSDTPKGNGATPPSNNDDQRPPMFYQRPAPLSASAHSAVKIRPEFDYSFTLKSNTVPVTAPEFVLAARSYPIIFIGGDLIPTAALGLRPDENFFVTDTGVWDRFAYVPAYVRRYPFILLGQQSDERLQLGIDETAVSDKADARALFEGEKETEVVRAALGMCEQFHQAYLYTREFSQALKDTKLVDERALEVQQTNGEKINMGSFLAVSEEKFKNLHDKKVLEWRKKGFLHAIYFHLQSLNNWDTLLTKANDRATGASA
ncbi:MAG: hypothetical protein EXR11_02230 [Rhodospirillaceae bacterium]|nr:hypothetical protein [Rhodospirillaceae bacterium]